jgi:hypothetical protein
MWEVSSGEALEACFFLGLVLSSWLCLYIISKKGT